MDEVFGPTFESEREGNALPEMQEATLLIEDFEARMGKEVNEKTGVHTPYAAVTYRVVASPGDQFNHRCTFENLMVSGGMAFGLFRMLRQCELDGILKYFDKKHEDYMGDEERPQQGGLTDADMWERVIGFFFTGQMEDGEGNTFDCEAGGLKGRKIDVKIGAPVDNTYTGEKDTGRIMVLKKE